MIEKLKNKVTVVSQVQKINEIIKAIDHFKEGIDETSINGLINRHTQKINEMKAHINDYVIRLSDQLNASINEKLKSFYRKSEANNKYASVNEEKKYVRYDDLNVGKNLVINVGSGPAIKFNKSDGTLFTIGDFDISAWPFKITKGNVQYMGVNNEGLISDKHIITQVNYKNFIKLKSWRDGSSIGSWNANDWNEAYAYNTGDNYQGIFLMVKNASKRRYDVMNYNSGDDTNMSVSFHNYYGNTRNVELCSRLIQYPGDSRFQVNIAEKHYMMPVNRPKFRLKYAEGWVIKCR